MFPEIVRIGGVVIYSYGLMLAAAIVVCSVLLSKDAKRALGIEQDAVLDLVFWTMIAGILGARLFYILLNLPFFIENPQEIIMLQHGGLAFQGGLVLGALCAAWIIRRKGWPFWKMTDLIAPYLALGHAIGRIGCFLNGCCYGRPADWGIYFPVHEAHLHPTQVYDTVLLTAVFFILKKFQKSGLKDGGTFALYLVFASAERVAVEFFRADHEVLLFGLSIFQYVSIVIFLGGAALWFYLKGNNGSKHLHH